MVDVCRLRLRIFSFARRPHRAYGMGVRKPVVACCSLLCGLWVAQVRGEPSPTPADPDATEDDAPTPEEGIPRPAAPDLRTRHWLLSAGGAVVAPSSGFAPSVGDFGAFSVGAGLRGALGFGLARHVLLRADGGAAWLTGATGCDDCSALSGDVGLGLVYVLAQGIAFDPWIGYGAGYRYAESQRPDFSASSHGVDVARLSLGGDFFPLPSFGFGPFIEADIGVQVDPETTGYAAFLAGMRLTFDPLRIGTEISPAVARR